MSNNFKKILTNLVEETSKPKDVKFELLGLVGPKKIPEANLKKIYINIIKPEILKILKHGGTVNTVKELYNSKFKAYKDATDKHDPKWKKYLLDLNNGFTSNLLSTVFKLHGIKYTEINNGIRKDLEYILNIEEGL